MASQDLDSLLADLTSGDDESRDAAALALGRAGAAALEPLAALLAGENAAGRWWAARALAEMGGDRSVQLLTGALVDADPDVRACACLALGQIGAASAAPDLGARLEDESAFVAAIAADALSMLGAGAVPALAQALHHERPAVRLLAVRALGRTRSVQAVEPLCGVLEDSSYLVSHSALEALEGLGVGMVYFSP